MTKNFKLLYEAHDKYQDIDTADKLSVNKLSLSDYDELGCVLGDLFFNGVARTLYAGVSEWCVKQGLKVTQKTIYWIIEVF